MLKRLNCLFARDCGEGLIVTAVLFEIGLVNDVGKVEAIRLKFIFKMYPDTAATLRLHNACKIIPPN